MSWRTAAIAALVLVTVVVWALAFALTAAPGDHGIPEELPRAAIAEPLSATW